MDFRLRFAWCRLHRASPKRTSAFFACNAARGIVFDHVPTPVVTKNFTRFLSHWYSTSAPTVTTTHQSSSPRFQGIPQRSPEWYVARKSLITASEAAALLPRDPGMLSAYMDEYAIPEFVDTLKYMDGVVPSDSYQSQEEGEDRMEEEPVQVGIGLHPFMQEEAVWSDKLGTGVKKGNSAMNWGQRFEPIALHYCSHPNGLAFHPITEYGLIVHTTDKWLGCSVDGVSHQNVIVEIKCPQRVRYNSNGAIGSHRNARDQYYHTRNRIMADGGGDPSYYQMMGEDMGSSAMGMHLDLEAPRHGMLPPKAPEVHWWIQVQLQLEVLGVEEGVILQCQFMEYQDALELFNDKTPRLLKGASLLTKPPRSTKASRKAAGDSPPRPGYIHPPWNLLEPLPKSQTRTEQISTSPSALSLTAAPRSSMNVEEVRRSTDTGRATPSADLIKFMASLDRGETDRASYWFLDNVIIFKVKRSRSWYSMAKPWLEEFWQRVRAAQRSENGGK